MAPLARSRGQRAEPACFEEMAPERRAWLRRGPTTARQLRNIAKWNGYGDFREKAFSSAPDPE